MELKVWYAVAKIDGKDRVYRWKKKQERGRMCERYQSFVFHGEVSSIPLWSEDKVTSRRGHHLFLGWSSVSYSSQVVQSMYRDLVKWILVSWSSTVC